LNDEDWCWLMTLDKHQMMWVLLMMKAKERRVGCLEIVWDGIVIITQESVWTSDIQTHSYTLIHVGHDEGDCWNGCCGKHTECVSVCLESHQEKDITQTCRNEEWMRWEWSSSWHSWKTHPGFSSVICLFHHDELIECEHL
jgi:hypothetical protein